MSCERKGKWFGGCKFEPRFDLSAPDLSRFSSFKTSEPEEVLEKMRKRTYVKDVCTTCGKSILRDEKDTTNGQ